MLKRAALLVLMLFIAVVVFTFVAKNTGIVSLDLAFATVTSSVAIVVTVAFVAGALFGFLCMGIYVLQLMNERRALRRSVRASESEVSSLRNLPLSDAD
jgi:putative membrane protein